MHIFFLKNLSETNIQNVSICWSISVVIYFFLSTFEKCHNLRKNNNKSQKVKNLTKCYGSTEEKH